MKEGTAQGAEVLGQPVLSATVWTCSDRILSSRKNDGPPPPRVRQVPVVQQRSAGIETPPLRRVPGVDGAEA